MSTTTTPPVTHYENFPVASWLCPRRLRPAVAAIYHFARTADDLADEGDARAAQRLQSLQDYRAALDHAASDTPYRDDGPWNPVMQPLQAAIHAYALPVPALEDLLTAFQRDIRHSEQQAVYGCHDDLLDYARYSANPVGRLMLHLYGVRDAQALARSDAICTALQLFNFWQDLSVDIPRGRYYLPQDLCDQFGINPRIPMNADAQPRAALLQALLDRTDQLMAQGAGLIQQVRAQAGHTAAWELRLVVQGGLRIGIKTRALGADAFARRPRLGAGDVLPMLLRACSTH